MLNAIAGAVVFLYTSCTMNLSEKETIEINHWNNSPYESPGTFSMQSIIYKLAEARVFWVKLVKYGTIFQQAGTILEIGAGQGWAGSLLKQQYPEKKIVVSDLSPSAMEVVSHWEHFLRISLDGKIVCKSYAIPFPDDALDIVFCYASAHHFVAHEKTLKEIYRVLKKGGCVIYLHEPSCRKYIYKIAYWRVNKKRPAVPEDVLVYKDMVNIAKTVGFETTDFFFDPTTINRGPIEGVYYALLQKISCLRHILPCTVDYIFYK